MSKKDIQNVDKEEVLEATEELFEEDDLSLIADEIDETENTKSDAMEESDVNEMQLELSKMKRQREAKKQKYSVKEIFRTVVDFLYEKKRITGPVVLLLCLGITIFIAVSANQKKETIVQQTEAEVANVEEEGIVVPELELEHNAHAEINELMLEYYKALAAGDMDTICTLVSPVTENYLIKLREVAKYLEAYPSVNIYTKPGPIENSYMVFAYTEVQMAGYDKAAVPGLATFYVCRNEEGKYYINIQEELDEDVAAYIETIDLQDDVIDLNNKVTVDFNNLLAEDPDFAAYYTEVDNQITAAIGAALDEMNKAENEPVVTEEETQEEEPATIKIVAATDVVNMRSSDSELSDKVGKAQIGDRFTLIEARANGWSKVLSGDSEVFIKSDYLEVVSETPDESADNNTADDQNAQETTTSYVTATTTVNVRSEASQTSDKLGKVQEGDKLELIEKQSDGWCKVKYKDKTGYVKAEYMR